MIARDGWIVRRIYKNLLHHHQQSTATETNANVDDANDTITDDDVDDNDDIENMNKKNHKNNNEVSITQQSPNQEEEL